MLPYTRCTLYRKVNKCPFLKTTLGLGGVVWLVLKSFLCHLQWKVTNITLFREGTMRSLQQELCVQGSRTFCCPRRNSSARQLSQPFRGESPLLCQPDSALLATGRAEWMMCIKHPRTLHRDPGNGPWLCGQSCTPCYPSFHQMVFSQWAVGISPSGCWIVVFECLISTDLSMSLYFSSSFSNKEPRWLKLSPDSISDLPLLTFLHWSKQNS